MLSRLANPSISIIYKKYITNRPKSNYIASITQQDSFSSTISKTQTKNEFLQNFENSKVAHETKTTSELLSALFVYQLCQIPLLIRHSEFLLSISNQVLGTNLTNKLIKSTFFKHFCAGETANDIKPKIYKLKSCGIGSILDYAAENDIPSTNQNLSPFKQVAQSLYNYNNNLQPARIYSYESESKCDAHVHIFRSCIQAVRDVTPEGFAAIKITALGNPLLLERISSAIHESKSLFSTFDTDNDGFITREEFVAGYKQMFKDPETYLPHLLERLDPNNSDKIDYIEWSKLLKPSDLPRIENSFRKKHHSLALASPTKEEIKLMGAMLNRADELAQEASKYRVRLLLDAEQYRYQPAIDSIALSLQQKYNNATISDVPIIFNTYQCYLKDMPNRMKIDLERSKRHDYHFGAKLVRGAYMVSERERALRLNQPSPVYDTIEETHECFDQSLEYLIRYRVQHNIPLQVMCATHNQNSIIKALTVAKELDIRPHDSTLHFAQLLGMSDNLTYPLGKKGFRAYKYVPYGQVQEVIPYLLRRAQENSAMWDKSKLESKLILEELKRRAFSYFIPSKNSS